MFYSVYSAYITASMWVYITEYTEWQWPLSGVHFIMMVHSAQPGEGGECTPSPFHSIYDHEQSCDVCSGWEGRIAPPISPLLLYALCGLGWLLFWEAFETLFCLFTKAKVKRNPLTVFNRDVTTRKDFLSYISFHKCRFRNMENTVNRWEENKFSIILPFS